MMLPSQIYKGIEYILVSDLPLSQRELLLKTIDERTFIKILIDQRIIGPCLQYKDYIQWYDMCYPSQHVAQEAVVIPHVREMENS